MRSRCWRRSEEHTSELQSPDHLVCRLLLSLTTISTLFPYTTLFRSPFCILEAVEVVLGVCALCSGVMNGVRCVLEVMLCILFCMLLCILEAVEGEAEGCALCARDAGGDRKSTRLNSSHQIISYAVFCFLSLLYLHSFPTRRSSDLHSVYWKL